MGKVLLKAENVSKFFGATKAVVDFSMEVNAGKVHGLIGENGSGKSTFSSIVAGILPRNAGQIYMDGEEYTPHSTVEAGRCSAKSRASDCAGAAGYLLRTAQGRDSRHRRSERLWDA